MKVFNFMNNTANTTQDDYFHALQKRSIKKQDYRPIEDFSSHQGVCVNRLIEDIRAGEYEGRLFDGKWFVHVDEFIRQRASA